MNLFGRFNDPTRLFASSRSIAGDLHAMLTPWLPISTSYSFAINIIEARQNIHIRLLVMPRYFIPIKFIETIKDASTTYTPDLSSNIALYLCLAPVALEGNQHSQLVTYSSPLHPMSSKFTGKHKRTFLLNLIAHLVTSWPQQQYAHIPRSCDRLEF